MTDSKQNNVTDTPVSDSTRQQGIVKWFNNRSGFGFVTTLGDDTKDIFVHHSGVSVNREQYKYLVQGEYVEFTLSRSSNTEHEFQATNVTGIGSGPLMCETRYLIKQERNEHLSQEGGDSRSSRPRRNRTRQRGSGPRDSNRSNNEFVRNEQSRRSNHAESS